MTISRSPLQQAVASQDHAWGRADGRDPASLPVRLLQRLHAVVGLEHLIALFFQQDGDGTDDFGIVIHHQNTLVHTNPSYGRYLTSPFCQRA